MFSHSASTQMQHLASNSKNFLLSSLKVVPLQPRNHYKSPELGKQGCIIIQNRTKRNKEEKETAQPETFQHHLPSAYIHILYIYTYDICELYAVYVYMMIIYIYIYMRLYMYCTCYITLFNCSCTTSPTRQTGEPSSRTANILGKKWQKNSLICQYVSTRI